MKAVILARVSTKRQEEEGLSLEEIQLPQMRTYAEDKGFEIDKEFTFSESADRKIRKKFDEMVAYVKSNKDVKALIAYRVDRITRNYRDHVEMDNLRLESDVELHFVNDRLVISKDTVGADITTWDVMVFLAKQKINRMKEDGRNSGMAKVLNGELPYKAPYGLKNITLPNKKKDVVVVPFEAGVVKEMFDWYTTARLSMSQIKIRLKTDYEIDMNVSTIANIIEQPIYYGEMVYNDELYPHKYETLITKDTYDLAQDIKSGRTKTTVKLAGKPYIYRGLMRCKVCDCLMTPEPKTKKQKNGNVHNYIYYHCTESKGKHNAVWLREHKITEQFAEVFKEMTIPQEDLEHMQKALSSSHEDKVDFVNKQITQHTTQYKKYQNRIEQAYMDKLDGSITQDEYTNYRKSFRAKQEFHKRKLAQLQTADEEYYITCSYLLELASRSHELFMSSELDEKRVIIQLVFQNLYMDKGNLCYDLQKPFDRIFLHAQSPSWLPRVDSNHEPTG
jgi:site-specific DNA recombinase